MQVMDNYLKTSTKLAASTQELPGMNSIHPATPGIGTFINNKKFPMASKYTFPEKSFEPPSHPISPLWGRGGGLKGGGVNHEMEGPLPPKAIGGWPTPSSHVAISLLTLALVLAVRLSLRWNLGLN